MIQAIGWYTPRSRRLLDFSSVYRTVGNACLSGRTQSAIRDKEVNAMLQQQKTTAERLIQLAHLYEGGQASPLLERTIDKVLAYEADVARGQLAQIRQDLAELERQYEMSTDTFVRLFRAGQADDRMDFIDWVSLAQMAEGLEARLQLLTDNSPP